MHPKQLEEPLLNEEDTFGKKQLSHAEEINEPMTANIPSRGLLKYKPIEDFNEALAVRNQKKIFAKIFDKSSWRPLDWELESIILSSVGKLN